MWWSRGGCEIPCAYGVEKVRNDAFIFQHHRKSSSWGSRAHGCHFLITHYIKEMKKVCVSCVCRSFVPCDLTIAGERFILYSLTHITRQTMWSRLYCPDRPATHADERAAARAPLPWAVRRRQRRRPRRRRAHSTRTRAAGGRGRRRRCPACRTRSAARRPAPRGAHPLERLPASKRGSAQ